MSGIGDDGAGESSGQMSTKLKYMYTFAIYACFLASGMMNITSATLLDIAEITHSRTADVSFGISIRFAAYCMGAPFFGWLIRSL